MLKKIFLNAAEAYAAPVCETLDFTVNEGIMGLSNGTNWSENPGGAGGNDGYGDGGNL